MTAITIETTTIIIILIIIIIIIIINRVLHQLMQPERTSIININYKILALIFRII